MMYVLIVVAILLALVGLVGAVGPGIAGTPFSFLALLVLSFVKGIDYSTKFLLIMGLIGAVVFALDYVVPIWGTKKLGGTKAGVRGSTIGLFLGLFITFVFPHLNVKYVRRLYYLPHTHQDIRLIVLH